jgi:AraC-like DNA-binding protein
MYTVSAGGVNGVLAYFAHRGLARARVLAGAGLVEADLIGDDARVAQATYHRVWIEGQRCIDDADLGLHFGEALELTTFDVVGHIALCSPTLGDAFERIASYARLLHDAGGVEVEVHGEDAVVYAGCRGLTHDVPRPIAEMSAVAILVLARQATRTPTAARDVAFRHPQPPSIREHRRIFGVAPRFGAVDTCLVIPRSALAQPVVGRDDHLARYLDRYAQDAARRLAATDDPSDRTRRAIVTALASRSAVNITAVARTLAVHPRTLQRQLEAAGTSFQGQLDAARRGLAERYLADHDVAIAEIAYVVGYDDVSNFHRAFRRWTGQTPAAYRAGLVAR